MEIRLERPSLWKEFSSLQSLSRVRLFLTPWTAALQASLSITNSQSLLKLMFIESVTPSISPSVVPFSSCPQSFPGSGSFPKSQFFTPYGQMMELQLQSSQWIFRIDFLYDWLVWSPCSPRSSQESSPGLQFESINSSALSLPYDPTLTSILDHWKNHSFN